MFSLASILALSPILKPSPLYAHKYRNKTHIFRRFRLNIASSFRIYTNVLFFIRTAVLSNIHMRLYITSLTNSVVSSFGRLDYNSIKLVHIFPVLSSNYYHSHSAYLINGRKEKWTRTRIVAVVTPINTDMLCA